LPPLTTPELETIQRLLVDPLRDAVRTELQAGHERLTLAIEKVAEQLAQHIAVEAQNALAQDVRLTRLEKRVTLLEQFRGRMLAGYAVLVLICSAAWSIVRDWIVNAASSLHRR
jgi:hypothetical protein